MDTWSLDSFWDKYSDKRMLNYPLMKNCLGLVTIVSSYLFFVFLLGPKLMQNRPAFKLRRVMLMFNATQMFLCSYIIFMIVKYVKLESLNCLTHQTTSSEDLELIFTAYVYWLIKVVDLLDTIFFVLRKKNNQISTLHVYHHTMMVIAGWVINLIYPAGELMWVGLFNCTVHIFMYFYYFCAVYYEGKINLWWKKYITQGQITQFVCLMMIYVKKMFDWTCAYPKPLLMFHITQTALMLYMFVNFYYHSYLKTKNAAKYNENSRNTTEINKDV